MIKYLFTLLIFYFPIIKVYSQENNNESCILKSTNLEWKNKFINTESKIEKIELIKNKIKKDSIFETNYSVTCRYPLKPKIELILDKNCEPKILFFINYNHNKFFPLDIRDVPKSKSIVELINIENIKEIKFLDSFEGELKFGEFGKSGVIILYTKDKTLKKEIKKII